MKHDWIFFSALAYSPLASMASAKYILTALFKKVYWFLNLVLRLETSYYRC